MTLTHLKSMSDLNSSLAEVPAHDALHPSLLKRSHRAFSMIEMIGVLAIMSIMLAAVGPNLLRKVLETVNVKEGKNLEVLADGLRRHVRSSQSIPGGTSWFTNVANTIGMNVNDVTYADPNNTLTSGRILMIYPGFTPATGTDPVLTSTSVGTVAPTNARMMIISCTKRGLALPVAGGKAANTAANRTRFDNIWNWTLNPFTKMPPTGWPTAWRGQAEHLHVQRINLADEFYRVTISNYNFPTNIPFGKFNLGATYPFDVTNATDGYFLRGATVRLYRHDTPYVAVPANPDELNVTHVLSSDVNFIYDGNPPRWRVQ